MKATSIFLFLCALLFSTITTFAQCEAYLQRAETLFSEKKYEEAKRQYLNYKECKPNATGIDELIKKCDQLISECETYYKNAETLFAQKKYEEAKRQYQNYKECKHFVTGIDEKIAECDRLILASQSSSNTQSIGNYDYVVADKRNETQTNSNNQHNISIRQPDKIYIGIGSFTGYKSDQADADATTSFTNDGRFIVSKVQNSRYGTNQQIFSDVDYIISGASNLIQRENRQTTYVNTGKYLGNRNIPITSKTPEIVNVVLTLTNAKTGQIVFNSTYNLNQIFRVSSDIFPVNFSILKINGKNVEIVRNGGGSYFIGDIYNVYEVLNNGGKNRIGALKIGKTNSQCSITEGAKEIARKFKLGANLIVER